MKKVMSLAVIALCCGAAWSSGGWPVATTVAAQSGGTRPL